MLMGYRIDQQTSAGSLETRRIAIHLESCGHDGVKCDIGKEVLDSGRALCKHVVALGTACRFLVGRVLEVELYYSLSPTKTAKGYMTPCECVYGEPPNLAHLRIWGVQGVFKNAEALSSKRLARQNVQWILGWIFWGRGSRLSSLHSWFLKVAGGCQCYIQWSRPVLCRGVLQRVKEVVVQSGPRWEYCWLFDLVGVNYFDDTDLEYNGMIVAYRAPMLLTGRTGREDKYPIHVGEK